MSLSLSGLFGSVPFCCSSKSFSPSSSESGLLGSDPNVLLRNQSPSPSESICSMASLVFMEPVSLSEHPVNPSHNMVDSLMVLLSVSKVD